MTTNLSAVRSFTEKRKDLRRKNGERQTIAKSCTVGRLCTPFLLALQQAADGVADATQGPFAGLPGWLRKGRATMLYQPPPAIETMDFHV